jgi:uncharacterized membrane protein
MTHGLCFSIFVNFFFCFILYFFFFSIILLYTIFIFLYNKIEKKNRDGERYACRIANKVISQRIRTIKEQNAKIEIHNDIIKKQNAKIETLEEEVKEVANEKYY